ncbi:MAG: hypothetical protein ACXWZP_04110 [Gaiellaceae bacterium]
MSTRRTSLAATAARIVWGGLALVLLIALLASVFLSRGSSDEAEAEAEGRAVDWANTVLFDALTPEQVQEPILGPDYRELLIIVQAGIRSDDRTARVRIWDADGVLVFSDDQRDKIGEFVATDNPHIETALSGETVSVPTQATVAPKSWLAGSDEKLFQTFVPLRLENQLGISGVVQIDQRYAAIESEASDTWQTIRLGLVIALTVVLGLFLFSLRARPVPAGAEEATEGAAPSRQDRRALERATKAEDQLRIMSERAEAAEAAAAEAEGTVNEAVARLRELEERAARAEERAGTAETALQEAAQRMIGGQTPRRGVPGVGAVAASAAAGDLEAKLAAAELEHERRVAELEQRAAEATRQAAEAETRITEVEGRLRAAEAAAAKAATAAKTRKTKEAKETTGEKDTVSDKEAQARAAAVEAVLAEVETRVREVETRATKAETRATEAEGKLAEADAARADLVAELERTRAETAKAPVPVAEPEDVEALRQRVAELEEARRDDVTGLQRAQEALANTQFESTQARRRVKELEGRLEELQAAPPVPGQAPAPDAEEPDSFAARLAHLAGEHEPGEEPEPAAEAEEVDESALSLRERLARAAAARHRTPGTPGSDR